MSPEKSFSFAAVLLLASCTPYQQQGAGLGALGGAAVGALAGDSRGDVVRGAAIGAAVGTGVASYQESQNRQNLPPPDSQRSGTAADGPPPRNREYPYAQKTNHPEQVISPFAPYNVIDVSGFRSGQLARDPSNQEIFRIP